MRTSINIIPSFKSLNSRIGMNVRCHSVAISLGRTSNTNLILQYLFLALFACGTTTFSFFHMIGRHDDSICGWKGSVSQSINWMLLMVCNVVWRCGGRVSRRCDVIFHWIVSAGYFWRASFRYGRPYCREEFRQFSVASFESSQNRTLTNERRQHITHRSRVCSFWVSFIPGDLHLL